MTWAGGLEVEFGFLHTVVVGSISNSGDHGEETQLRKKQLYSVPYVTFSSHDNSNIVNYINLFISVWLSVFARSAMSSACLEREAGGIGPHLNADKTKYMCFNHLHTKGWAFESSGQVHLQVSPQLRMISKAWITINWQSVIWKSDRTDKIKRSFFQGAVVSTLLYGCTTWTLTKRMEKSHKNAASNIEQVLEAALHKAAAVLLFITHHEKLSKLDEPDMRDTAGEAGTNSKAIHSCGSLHFDEQR